MQPHDPAPLGDTTVADESELLEQACGPGMQVGATLRVTSSHCSGWASTKPPPAWAIAASAHPARATPSRRDPEPVNKQPIRQSGNPARPLSWALGFLMLATSAGGPY